MNDYWKLTSEYNSYQYIDFHVFSNDYDAGGPIFADGQPFHFYNATNGTWGWVESASVQCSDASGYWCVRYHADYYGPFTDTFTYSIIDAGGNISTASVTIVMPA